jgi:hypothetical protein
VRREVLRREIGVAGGLGTIDGIAESLREAIDGFSSAKQVETELALIERLLGGLSRAIQLLPQSIENGHCTAPF